MSFKNWAVLCAFVSVFSLFGCGGGGDSVPTEPGVVDNLRADFPLAEFDNREKSEPVGAETVETGLVIGVSTDGSTTFDQRGSVILTSRRLQNGRFEGVPAKTFFEEMDRKYTIFTGFYVDGVLAPAYNFYAEDNKVLGGAYVMAYVVTTESFSYPSVVRSGDSGVRYRGVVYRDSTKSSQVGTVESAWKIESIEPYKSGENAIANITITDTNYGLNGAVRSKVATTIRLTHPAEFSGFNRALHSKRITTVEEYNFRGLSEKFTTQWD